MADRRQFVRLAVAAGAAAAGSAILQRQHMHRIAADPERALLDAPLVGEPLNIRAADGTELYAESFGLAEGPTLVLIHGWTEALRYWVYVIRELEEDFRIVAYDLRGHGRSGRTPDEDYSMARFG